MTRRTITDVDGEWPRGLARLGPRLAPARLHVVGGPLSPDEQCIAVVGTRRPTAAGLDATRTMTRAFVEAGFTIVSGLAMGVDAAAHDEALKAQGGTVAVLGCGVDVCYPDRNARLWRAIRERGTLVTEYPDGTAPHAHHFPQRNRIIAGLTCGVLVVEGGQRSGALITARYALEANRLVWAIPGSIRNAMAAGPNELIRAGEAALVTEPRHVFDEIAPSLAWRDGVAPGSTPDLGEHGGDVLGLLDDTPVPLERVATELRLAPGAAAMALSRLEIRGFALRRLAGYEITQAGARVRAQLVHNGPA